MHQSHISLSASLAARSGPHRSVGPQVITGNQKGRGPGESGSQVDMHVTSAFFFLMSFFAKQRVGLHIGSSASVVSYHTPSSKTHTLRV